MYNSEISFAFEDSIGETDSSSFHGNLEDFNESLNSLLEPQASDIEEGSLAVAQSPTIRSHQPTKLLLVSLIESYCQVYGDTPEIKRQVFLKLCQRLSQAGIIHYEFVDELASLRLSYHQAFNQLFYQTKSIVKRGSPRMITTADSLLSIQQSRYRNDFLEQTMIGRGGFASAWRARNKLDDIVYAVKKIRLLGRDDERYETIFREIKSLARLEHRNVVRYYSSWLEYASIMEKEELDGEDYELTEEDSMYSVQNTDIIDGFILYIQMQLCPSNLHERITIRNQKENVTNDLNFVKDNRHLFCQILEGAAYIHEKGLIHRDLKPSNIFLSYEADIAVPKIGDFGLAASIVEQEQAEEDGMYTSPMITEVDELSTSPTSNSHINLFSAAAANSSVRLEREERKPTGPRRPCKEKKRNRTVGVGTRTYAAPEQLAGTTYDEKADIYSLGIILFELFHPFSTGMERSLVLNELKHGNKIPKEFQERYPKETELIYCMMHPNPYKRPSASELCKIFHEDDTQDAKYLKVKQEKEELEKRLNELEAQLAKMKYKDEAVKVEEISHALSQVL